MSKADVFPFLLKLESSTELLSTSGTDRGASVMPFSKCGTWHMNDLTVRTRYSVEGNETVKCGFINNGT